MLPSMIFYLAQPAHFSLPLSLTHTHTHTQRAGCGRHQAAIPFPQQLHVMWPWPLKNSPLPSVSSLKALSFLKLQHCRPAILFAYRSFSLCPSASLSTKKKLVFLGTPKVAAYVLDQLLVAAQAEKSLFEIAAIVTQPPAVRGRGQKLVRSPVAEVALDKNFSESKIFWPQKAGEDTFLAQLSDVKPDLCITAAYGNILPRRFLQIPTYGTVNIHPSLLPLYRGAAPVQRAVEDGVPETGVSVAFTVRAMDAGPIIASEAMAVDEHIKAPKLLQLLFEKGVQLLLRELPSILDGSAAEKAREQDHARATHAAKVTVDEAWLDFTKSAGALHNKVRAFADWPGAKAKFQVVNPSGAIQNLDLKIVTTRVHAGMGIEGSNGSQDQKIMLKQENSSLIVYCGANSALEILELQPPGKRVMSAKAFLNGLRGQQIRIAI